MSEAPGDDSVLLFNPSSLEFCDASQESLFWKGRGQALLTGDRRITRPYVLVHVGLLLKLLQSGASIWSMLLCLICTLSVAAAARMSSCQPHLWSRIRESFLSVGHVLYMAEGSAMLHSFAVVVCQPAALMWVACVMTSATPWLLLDPLMMPISYRNLRWVQPLSFAVLLPSNGLRCHLNLVQCPAATARFQIGADILDLLSSMAVPPAIHQLLTTTATHCSCRAIITYVQMLVGVVVVLRLAKERERRARQLFAVQIGQEALAHQLRHMGTALTAELFMLLFLACALWPLAQQLSALLP